MANNIAWSLSLSSRAEKEIGQAWEWYEDRQYGLGGRFVKEIAELLRRIEQNPTRYPLRYKSYRETSVPVFPYLIIYRISEKKKTIRIVSVFHTSLNPKKKLK